MSTTDQYLLALHSYQELQSELRQAEPALLVTPEKEPPIAEISAAQPASFPGGSLLFGTAEDGLPVLLDLYDPAPGPLLVAGDTGSGKTTFLQSLVRVSALPDPGDIQFGVVTPFPEEWSALEALPHCLGIWPAGHPSAQAFLSQLVSWAETLPQTRQAVLLFFDGFDLLAGSDSHIQNDLRWLLLYGPEHHIWPVLTLNPARLTRSQSWLEYFHTRVIGRVRNSHNARLLVNNPQAGLPDLLPGTQFGLSQPNGWLKFTLPPLD